MSLKALHLVFVTALSGLTFGLAAWLLITGATVADKRADLFLGGLSFLVGVAVIIYGRYFLKKLKNVSYL